MKFINSCQLLSKMSEIKKSKTKVNVIMILLLVLPILIFAISIMSGRYSISYDQFVQKIASKVTGIVVSTLFQSLISLLKYVADTEENLKDAYGINVKIIDTKIDSGEVVKSCIPLLN